MPRRGRSGRGRGPRRWRGRRRGLAAAGGSGAGGDREALMRGRLELLGVVDPEALARSRSAVGERDVDERRL